MNNTVRELEPKALWNHFADLNAVPRPSKEEERVIAFMKKFGEDLGFPTMVDEVGNVIIKKPATAGMEDRPILVMQSHLDMVCVKNNDTDFDFNTQGIDMYIDGDWVKAKGTTLGADNGIGVATIMAILASDDIEHPAIEALFTIDEETGMTGALGLKGGLLDGRILLNLDTEDDDELTIGCAGGVDVTATNTYAAEDTPANHTAYTVTVKGLTGGHSGMDIHKGRGNANKLMNRILRAALQLNIRVASIVGGGKRNAIPRESVAVVAIPNANATAFEALIEQFTVAFVAEHSLTDPELTVTLENGNLPDTVLPDAILKGIITAIAAALNGIYRMTPGMDGLVQTSNNVARVEIGEGNIKILCLTRGSVDSEKMDLAENLKGIFDATGASTTFSGEYPGWAPRPEMKIIKVMRDIYVDKFGTEPNVNACHAGLECGILGTNYPGMEMISFGPNIRGAHSPDEKVQISSVQKYWALVIDTLKGIK